MKEKKKINIMTEKKKERRKKEKKETTQPVNEFVVGL